MNFVEKLPISLYLANLELIDESNSKFNNRIQIFRHEELGKILILDGEIHNIEAWTALYHETIVHLPAAFIENIESVLILGGGCFFAAHEVLKYRSIKEVIMIEHDKTVVDLVSRNFKHPAAIIKDKRFRLEICDAFKGIKKLNKKFDLIINDSVDLINYFAGNTFNPFHDLLSYTNKNSVCCDLVYRHIFEKNTTQKTIKLLKVANLNSVYSLVSIPEYPGILHLLTIWGRNKKIKQDLKEPLNEIQKLWKVKSTKNPCVFYNPAFLNYYLYLPPYLKKVINGC